MDINNNLEYKEVDKSVDYYVDPLTGSVDLTLPGERPRLPPNQPIKNWFRNLRFWIMNKYLNIRYGPSTPDIVKCDSCDSTFDTHTIYACSGDCWLCGPCLDDYMNTARLEYESERNKLNP